MKRPELAVLGLGFIILSLGVMLVLYSVEVVIGTGRYRDTLIVYPYQAMGFIVSLIGVAITIIGYYLPEEKEDRKNKSVL